ncbi:MAG: DUF2341 domain-containing protein, partial [Bacteroidetes bacterium]|nr:DUF2341 domain-containing protein [Bacteroidota bacterium]
MGNKRVPGFIILFLTFLTQPVSLYPQGSCCDLPGWDYYSLITIDNTCCAVTYTNRGYLIEVNTQALISAGKMNASGSDIRFKDGFCNPNLLDYCFESGVNTPNTLIWVKLPSLPANGVTQIYMFFGNTSAFPAQNCASIFQNVLTVTSSTSMSGVQTYDEIDIQGGAVITVSSGSILELNALKITMAGTITGNNAGYGPQSGPGSGVNGGGGVGGSGGSYGGSGGSGGGGFPAPYGTTSGTDIDMGSGGGGSDCSPSAAGGGAVKLVADFISVTGTITMNGQNAANCCCGNTSEAAGGGAGGGILIQCDYASGNGQLIARGGRGGDSDTKEGGGGGGGGRIKICYSKTNNFSGTTDVAGGQPGVGPQSGETAGQNGTSSFFICTEAAITVNPDQPVKIVPVPGFTFSNICANGTASFTNTSTITPPGQIVANNWDFGDAGTSTLQSPTHIYTSPGTFNVTLTVTSDSGCIAAYNTAITVGPYPVAGFTTSNVCGYDTVQFNNITTISGGTVTYLWNFGDASTSTLQNPSHFYTAPNTYSVTLTATSDNGCVNTATQPVTVYPVPAASFTITNSGYICLDQAGTFTNTSTILSGTVTYGWDFGDGGTSFLTSPSHIYANPGTYLVTLAALSNYNCLDTVMRNIVVSPEPVAGFTIADVCLNNPSIFSDVSTISGGTISTWQWNFGDGIGNSVLQNPVYQYASPGNFNVQLVVTSNNNCQDTAIKAVNIFPLPNADFTFTNACFGQPNTFTDASSIQNDNIVTWIWDFGDASSAATANTFHTYSAVNSYNVELLVTSSNGCKDSISYTVTVSPNPVPDFTPVNVCETSPAVFTSASTVSSGSIAGCVWDFGDFDTSMSCNTTHLYAGDGTYLVTLLAMTDKNCFDTVKKNIIIYPAPTADFTFVPACEGFITVFTDISTVNNDIITGWQWDFGDASPFDNTQSPQHTYASDGIYQVELITFSGSGCSDTIKKSVESYIVPVAFFSATSVCEQEITQFTDMSSQTDTLISWTWDFGDGTPPVYLQNPSY